MPRRLLNGWRNCPHLQTTGCYNAFGVGAEHRLHGRLVNRIPLSGLHIGCEECCQPRIFLHSIGVIKSSRAPWIPPVIGAPALQMPMVLRQPPSSERSQKTSLDPRPLCHKSLFPKIMTKSPKAPTGAMSRAVPANKLCSCRGVVDV